MQYLIISILALSQTEICYSNNSFNNAACNFKIDTLTSKVIYTSADISPVNEGGQSALAKRLFNELSLDDVPPDASFRVYIEVAFIVDVNGNISGERIVSSSSKDIAEKMLKIIKQFKWKPAICKGKKVAMLHSVHILGCPVEA